MRPHLPLALGGALALSALGGSIWHKLSAREAKAASPAGSNSAASSAPSIPVDVVRVSAEPLQVHVQASGTLLPRESVELVSELSRRLLKVRAEEGSNVKKGQVLFELDAADLNAELGKLDVQTRLAKATLDRGQRLLNEGLSTQQELDTAEANADAAQAQRRLLAVTLSKTLIRAPFAGKLGLRRVSEGAWVTSSTVLSTLQDTSTLKLDFTLPERYAGLVAAGSEFTFKTAGRGDTFKAKVAAQEPMVDKATRSIVVRGVIENQPSLLPGAFATVEVPLHTDQALLVPNIAIVPGVDGRRVFVVDGERVRSVLVELGTRSADRVQVLSGLKAGDQVVVSNLLRVRDRAKVKVLPAGKP